MIIGIIWPTSLISSCRVPTFWRRRVQRNQKEGNEHQCNKHDKEKICFSEYFSASLWSPRTNRSIDKTTNRENEKTMHHEHPQVCTRTARKSDKRLESYILIMHTIYTATWHFPQGVLKWKTPKRYAIIFPSLAMSYKCDGLLKYSMNEIYMRYLILADLLTTIFSEKYMYINSGQLCYCVPKMVESIRLAKI